MFPGQMRKGVGFTKNLTFGPSTVVYLELKDGLPDRENSKRET